jgi:hypothetical protein
LFLAAKIKLDATLSLATPTLMARLDLIGKLLGVFKFGVHITSARGCPGSAYFPLVIAVQNDVFLIFANPSFDLILGEGAADECRAILAPRWNLCGRRPQDTRKVGLIDKHHIHMFLADPYARWLNLFHDLDGKLGEGCGRAGAVQDMLRWAYPDEPDKILEITTQRTCMKLNFDAFCAGSGPFASTFEYISVPMADNHVLTVADVSKWVQDSGGHEQRLSWYESNAKKSVLCTDAAKQLLSVCISGSMGVERAAKPLKNAVLVKDRNAQSVGVTEMALRAGLNLRFLQAAKINFRTGGASL